jgi:hypothetical protein
MRALLALLLLTACNPVADLPDGFIQSLQDTGGCGDLTLVAASSAHEIVLMVEAPDLVAPAVESDEVTRYTWRLPDDLAVVAVEGAGVTPRDCVDVETAKAAAVRTLRGTQGLVELVVTPRALGPAGEHRAHVDLRIREFILREETGEPGELGDIDLDFDVGPRREGFDIGDVVFGEEG